MTESITIAQCDAAFSGIINFAHGIEKFMRVAEEYYIQKVRKEAYEKKVGELFLQNLIKGMSRPMAYAQAEKQAEEAIKQSTKYELEYFGPVPYKRFLEKVREVIDMVDEFTEVGMEDSKPRDGENKATIYDYMMHDSDLMCRVFCRFYNIDGKDENAEKAIKRYESKAILDEEFMDKWFRTQGVETPKRKK